jgi:hypothetical protein
VKIKKKQNSIILTFQEGSISWAIVPRISSDRIEKNPHSFPATTVLFTPENSQFSGQKYYDINMCTYKSKKIFLRK